MSINFISSKDTDESRTMYTRSNNIVITMGNETDEIIEELFESHLQKYQERLVKKLQEVNLSLISLIYCIIIFIK